MAGSNRLHCWIRPALSWANGLKNYINYNITHTKQVFILLASLTLRFFPFYWVYTTALDTLGKSRSEKMDIQWGKKTNLFLPHTWVNPPLKQWDAPWWLKGSIWPQQASAGTLSMPVCLPPFLILGLTSSAGACCSLHVLTEKDCPMGSSQQLIVQPLTITGLRLTELEKL